MISFFREVYALLFPSDDHSKPIDLAWITDIRDEVNKVRAKYGRGPVRLDTDLNLLAQGWANKMAEDDRLYHGDFNGRITHAFPNTAGAEDVAEGEYTVAQVIAAWMASRPHRENLLGADYHIMGIGRARARDGSRYWVIDLDSTNVAA